MVAKPSVCPKCEGRKRVDGVACSVCDGEGVVWDRRDASEAAADGPYDQVIDLTYHVE